MDILYGVNATGDGHTSRARTLSPHLKRKGDIDLTYLFSGRVAHEYKDMGAFPDYQRRNGLILVQKDGKIDTWGTVKETLFGEHNLCRMFCDVAGVKSSDYDCVVTDFEPITSYAARLKRMPHIGIAHQYSFRHSLPAELNPWRLRLGATLMSPIKNHFGLHWDSFGKDILPPIFKAPLEGQIERGMILVYLGHEELSDIRAMLRPFTNQYEFHIYHKDIGEYDDCRDPGLVYKPKSSIAFKQDMAHCAGLITNAGFVSPSEVLHLGRKLLVKPVDGQIEQVSNARALEYLGYGRVMDRLDINIVRDWLDEPRAAKVRFPNVAEALSEWIVKGDFDDKERLKRDLWYGTEVHRVLKV
ncbi:MAG: glycosyltransferase family protein [Pseudomonadota bacterium]|nr:glycosyltransferase family protein [Pseudomonadota bacterium]